MSAKKISRRVREEAIEACLLRADEWRPGGNLSVPEWIPPLAVMALRAYLAVAFAIVDDGGNASHTAWLESASMLLDGWSPGDPIEVLR